MHEIVDEAAGVANVAGERRLRPERRPHERDQQRQHDDAAPPHTILRRVRPTSSASTMSAAPMPMIHQSRCGAATVVCAFGGSVGAATSAGAVAGCAALGAAGAAFSGGTVARSAGGSAGAGSPGSSGEKIIS